MKQKYTITVAKLVTAFVEVEANDMGEAITIAHKCIKHTSKIDNSTNEKISIRIESEKTSDRYVLE